MTMETRPRAPFSMTLTLLTGVFLAVATAADAADWPHWRGPDYNGISAETDLPTGAIKTLWTAELGPGFASMAVVDGKLYALGNIDANGERQDVVYCLDAQTGKEIWRHSYAEELFDRQHEGGPCGTPTVVDGRVYTLSKTAQACCLDAQTGKLVWFRQLAKDEGLEPPTWRFSSSALVTDSLVLYNVGDAGLAVDKATGKTAWRNGTGKSGYSTPVPFTVDGIAAAAIMGADNFVAVRVDNGGRLWRMEWKPRYDINAADPIIVGNEAFISSGYGHGSALTRFTAEAVETVWQNKEMRNQVNSCVRIGEHVYGFDGQVGGGGQLKCLTWDQGQPRWSQEGLGTGSLIATADGTLIVLGERGDLALVKADPQAYTELQRSQILEGKCWTAPVLANGLIYARNAAGKLVCVQPGPNQ